MKVVKKRSAIHNFGLFAKEDIAPNSFIIEYKGELITPIEAEIRERLYAPSGTSYLFEIAENKIIDGGRKGNIAKYINHSCDPNCKVKVKDDRIFIYAKRKILKGEELTIDYNFSKNAMKEECKCGSKNCRGTIS